LYQQQEAVSNTICFLFLMNTADLCSSSYCSSSFRRQVSTHFNNCPSYALSHWEWGRWESCFCWDVGQAVACTALFLPQQVVSYWGC